METKLRYTDEELEEFKELILKKLAEAKNDLALFTEAFSNAGENSTNDTAPTFKLLEEGRNVMSKEENSQMATRQMKFIKSLEGALERIDNKSYGICRETGVLIPKERLRAVPHATLSIEAKMKNQR